MVPTSSKTKCVAYKLDNFFADNAVAATRPTYWQLTSRMCFKRTDWDRRNLEPAADLEVTAFFELVAAELLVLDGPAGRCRSLLNCRRSPTADDTGAH